jgi:tRNA dimethylallyltransferase
LIQKTIGQKKFYEKLSKIDPLIVNHINSTDVQRSIRAYEVKLFTKKSILEWYKGTKSQYKKEEFIKLCIDYPRTELIKKIDLRTREMFDIGVIFEIKEFLKLKISKNKSISKAIGIAEIKDFIKKKITKDQVIEKISIKTRQYAKRQVTWSRGHMTSWKKIKPKNLESFTKKI